MATPGTSMPEGFIAPNVTPKCTWSAAKDNSESPHHNKTKHVPPIDRCILPNILEMVGNTPMVRLDKIAKSEGLECELVAKCEYFNAGGSVKDRIGVRMVEEAERDGLLNPGDIIIEPTSGNTGIGLALTSAVKGYRCIIVMPEKMSNEKVSVLKALGAEIVRTPTSAGWNTPESHVGVAWKLKNEVPNSHILDQYRNAYNPLAHYDSTAQEIIDQCEGKLDMVIVGAGTGGTVAGIGRKFKEVMPQVQIIGVDPIGSILAEPKELNEGGVGMYHVEGVGYDFIPTVLDRSVVDKWYKSADKESFHYARRLIREEGLLCGGSSGSALAAAIKEAKTLKAGQRCVVILPDSIRNYLSKFCDDSWMVHHRFLEPEIPKGAEWWWSQPITSLSLQPAVTIRSTITCREATEMLKREQINQVPVLNDNGDIIGVVLLNVLTSKIVSGDAKLSDPVSKILRQQFEKLDVSANLGRLSQILKQEQFVIVTRIEKCSVGEGAVKDAERIHGIVTSINLLDFICSKDTTGKN